ncbi:MAG: hypothetical protein E6K76_02580 [Candidatus Eisenbacteria bacterium]|uniref:Uncharacterized protein n=1 Tax=Eiseniibacteriota bacterium TaxID=2212470 RepID=A0A538T9B1_UNCEI|nr:MAG: hypothetical protein E6K76_02580 [Candidatus Eisenbacteria bacterium]
MNDRKLQRLMNDQLDGIATPAESERLRRELASSEDARIEYRNLGGVFDVLNRAEMEDPPPDLKQNVMQAIRHRAVTVPVPVRRSWLESIKAAFRTRPAFGYAYSFAAGAALAILTFTLLSGNLLTKSGVESGPFTGTMLPASGLSHLRRTDSREFTFRGGRVLAEMLSGRDGLVARITARAPQGTEVEVSFDPGQLDAVALRQHPVAPNDVLLGSGRLSVRIRHIGESQYLLYLARRGPAGSPLRIAIHSPDGLVQGELETRAPGSGS